MAESLKELPADMTALLVNQKKHRAAARMAEDAPGDDEDQQPSEEEGEQQKKPKGKGRGRAGGRGQGRGKGKGKARGGRGKHENEDAEEIEPKSEEGLEEKKRRGCLLLVTYML